MMQLEITQLKKQQAKEVDQNVKNECMRKM
jgi:hypothetical protein